MTDYGFGPPDEGISLPIADVPSKLPLLRGLCDGSSGPLGLSDGVEPHGGQAEAAGRVEGPNRRQGPGSGYEGARGPLPVRSHGPPGYG